MEYYKIISIAGLVFDAIGVCILLRNEIKNHKISDEEAKGFSKEDDEWSTKNIKEGRDVPFRNKKATALRIIHSYKISTLCSRTGLILLMLGFGLQIIGLLIS